MVKQDLNNGRKKIWEIDHGYLCATVGSCLNRAEMRRLAKDIEFRGVFLQEDHALHVFFIEAAKSDDRRGKALQRFFDKKYRQATRAYFLTADNEEIATLWRNDLAMGRIDRAWYAVVTHPAVNAEQAGNFYAQLHMLAHDGIANFSQRRLAETRLHQRLAELEEQLGQLKQLRKADKKDLRDKQQEAQANLTLVKKLQRENSQLHEQMAQVRHQPPSGQSPRDQEDVLLLAGELTSARRELELAGLRFHDLQEQHLALMHHHEEQHKELLSFENLLLNRLTVADPCEECNNQSTINCPGRNLCGQTVLYVGGLHKMIPHYKQLVETLGGRFLHHDGGKEESRNLLPKMLATADAVLCPIDCVSHDACLSVKKICKRYQKPFVMMRSASLSALAKGLTDIVQ